MMHEIKFIDDRQPPSSIIFPPTEKAAIAQGKRLVSQLFSQIIRQFYGEKFTITDIKAQKNNVIGIFRGVKDYYQFEINPNGNFNYIETSRDKFDAKKCNVGKGCGDTCISKGKKCSGEIESFGKIEYTVVRNAAVYASNRNWAKAGAFLVSTFVLLEATKTFLTQQLNDRVDELVDEEIAAKNSIKKTISDTKLNKKIDKLEDGIKDNDFENLIIINPKNGEVQLNKKGKEKEVSATLSELAKSGGAIVTHNHPKLDFPFSPPDIKTGMMTRTQEIRVVSPVARYSMKPPKDGWSREYHDKVWLPVYEKNQAAAIARYRKAYANRKVTTDIADVEFRQLAVETTAKELGVPYTRKPLKGRVSGSKLYNYTKLDSLLKTKKSLRSLNNLVKKDSCKKACECQSCALKKKKNQQIVSSKREKLVNIKDSVIITDRETKNLVTNILNRTSVKVKKVENLTVRDGAIKGNFWAMNGGYYKFSLPSDGKLSYQPQKTQRWRRL